MKDPVTLKLMQSYEEFEIDLPNIINLAYQMVRGEIDNNQYNNKRQYAKRTNTQKFIELGIARDLYTIAYRELESEE